MVDGDLSAWYNGIPQITRWWFTGTVVLPLLGRIGLLSPWYMVLEWNLLFYHWHIWRPITALFFYPITPQTGFHWLLMLYFLYQYSSRTETGVFDGRPADYMFMLLFCWGVSCIVALFAGVYFLLECMVMAVLYVWCQLNRDQIVQFWFGTQFKAMYLPWILLAFNMILRGGGMNELIGILVGHLYFFIMFKYPQDFGGATYLNTPQFLYNWLPNRRGGIHGFGSAPTARPGGQPGGGGPGPARHNWGQGQALGGGGGGDGGHPHQE